jgi:aminoglycoside phosphotransferase
MMVVQPSSTRIGGCDSHEKSNPLDAKQLIPDMSNSLKTLHAKKIEPFQKRDFY